MKTELETKLLALIQRRSKAINNCSNNMVGTPTWRKLKYLIKLYYKKVGITELTFAEAQEISLLNKEYSKTMTVEINYDLFHK